MRAARFFFGSFDVKTYLAFLRPSSTAFTLCALPPDLSTATTAGARGPLGEAGRFFPLSGERRRRPARGALATGAAVRARRLRPRRTGAAGVEAMAATTP